MPEFLELKSCQNCRGRFLTEPRRLDIDTRRDVPEHFDVAFHLCTDCAQTLRARRSEIWGWLIPRPGARGASMS